MSPAGMGMIVKMRANTKIMIITEGNFAELFSDPNNARNGCRCFLDLLLQQQAL